MELFFEYIRQKRRVFIMQAVFAAIFIVTFVLYRLPVAAVLYPVGICVGAGVLFMIYDYREVKKRHDRLSKIQNFMDISVDELPEPETIADKDYSRIIELLCEEQSSTVTNMNLRYDNMIEYYTVWVHQIKTPIAAMKLHLQNEDSALSRTVASELLRIEQYVEMVLVFLRLDSSSTDYVIREYELDNIVRQAVKKVAGEFIQRKLTLNYSEVKALVITDEKWLSFVIEQVLSNALKYTRTGGITIYCESGNVLCIKDTGIGIASEDLPRIFEKGYTGYNGRGDKKASGIGLYLCKRICSNLGHDISAFSAPGEGTTIKIDLGRNELEVE